MAGVSGGGTGELTFSLALGKRVRLGPPELQAVSTVGRIEAALAEGRREDAAQLVDYFMEEAKVCHAVYGVWAGGFDRWLAEHGLAPAALAAERERLARLLAFPDGSPFDPEPRWLALGGRAGELAAAIRAGAAQDAAIAGLDGLRESWRQLHDRWADLMSALLALVAERHGEEAVGDCYRDVLAPYLAERYAPFDTRLQPYEETVARNVHLAFESMRGHLSGPGRRGDLAVIETDDSITLEFAPCGSGGRGQVGDPIEGTGSRADPPYGFRATTAEHDWAGNETGVCLYCAHCVFALELWPIEQWGHPVRTVDPPLHPQETTAGAPTPCRWTIWKRLDAIPDSAYARVGARRPERA